MSEKSVALLVTFLLLLNVKSNAQKETNQWYFGDLGALDFNSDTPVVLSNSAMSDYEGCSSIADANGNLLFYTEGTLVWNRNHQVMPNGSGLDGGGSSSQAALIVKQPNVSNIYFIFTTDAEAGSSGFRYSIVDITQDNGFGDVIQKNIPILSPTCEKLTAVKKNAHAIWIATHEWSTNNFYLYSVDSSGLNITPVISSIGTIEGFPLGNAIGCMKFSCNGKRLALAINYAQIVEVYDFDRSTGILNHPVVIAYDFPGGPYGVEFSPNSNVLYVANESSGDISHVYQWNLLAGTDSDIINSMVTMGNLPYAGTLQLASNGKIYLAQTNTNSVGAINFPNVVGTGCDFQTDAIDLSPANIDFGLPNFVASYFHSFSFTYTGICPNDTTCFAINDTSYIDSVKWNFDDSLSGNANISSNLYPCHSFTSPGNYSVELIVCSGGECDTLFHTVEIINASITFNGQFFPFVNIDFFSNSTNAISWNWNFGDGFGSSVENPQHTYLASGNYSVELTVMDSFGCSFTTSIEIAVFGVESSLLENNFAISVIPNPFVNDCYLSYTLPYSSDVNIDVWNSQLQKVAVLTLTQKQCAGKHTYLLPTVGEGIYFVRVVINDATEWLKVIRGE